MALIKLQQMWYLSLIISIKNKLMKVLLFFLLKKLPERLAAMWEWFVLERGRERERERERKRESEREREKRKQTFLSKFISSLFRLLPDSRRRRRRRRHSLHFSFHYNAEVIFWGRHFWTFLEILCHLKAFLGIFPLKRYFYSNQPNELLLI